MKTDEEIPVAAALEELLKDKKKYERLLVYADKRLNCKCNFNDDLKLRLPDADDIVQTVNLKILNGTRPWDRKKYPDLFLFFIMQIKSVISNEFELVKNKEMTLKTSEFEDDTFLDSRKYSDDQEINRIFFAELYKSVEEILKTEDECMLVLDCMKKGMQVKDIEKDLGITKTQVVNIKRRISYKIQNAKIFKNIKLQI